MCFDLFLRKSICVQFGGSPIENFIAVIWTDVVRSFFIVISEWKCIIISAKGERYSDRSYGNATLAGIPQYLLRRSMQSVMNVAARLIYSSSRFDHITPLLRQLHWLKGKERIDFKLAVLVFKCVDGSVPPYLADELSRPADSPARCRLRSASSSIHVVRRTRLTTVGHFRSLRHVYGTIFHSTSSRHLPIESLKIVWRLIYFLLLLLNLYILFVKCLRGDLSFLTL